MIYVYILCHSILKKATPFLILDVAIHMSTCRGSGPMTSHPAQPVLQPGRRCWLPTDGRSLLQQRPGKERTGFGQFDNKTKNEPFAKVFKRVFSMCFFSFQHEFKKKTKDFHSSQRLKQPPKLVGYSRNLSSVVEPFHVSGSHG